MKHKGEYRRALRKVKHFAEGVWCGNLRFTEILALIHYGCQPESPDSWVVRYSIEHVKIGNICTTWFYFKPGKNFLKDVKE